MSRASTFAAAVLLAALVFQGVWSARSHSPAADEFAHHIASGYSYWKTRDFRMNPGSPPLPRMLGSFPLLLLGARAPLDHPSWDAGNSPEFARQFFYHANNRPLEFIFWARLPMVGLSTAFALCLYLWVRRRFGAAAAAGALALYVFNADVLAHSSLVGADLGVAFFFFLTVVSFLEWLETPAPGRAVMTGCWMGMAFLSKYSAVMLLPALLGIAALSGGWRALKARHVALSAAALFLVLWAGYGFEMKPLLKDTPDPAKKEAVYRRIGGEALVRFASDVPVPLSTFSSGFVSMMVTRARGTNAFLLGEWSRAGWWYYYFVAFAVKNSPPFLILLVLGWAGLRKMPDKRLFWTLVFPPLLFFIVTMPDRAQAGIRYFLPVYPFLFAAAGSAFAGLWSRRGLAAAVGAGLLAWHAGEAAAVAPHYLSYFSPVAGGPANGYRVLRDSNLDWGQDLPELARKTREKYGRVALHYPWPADPKTYGTAFRTVDPIEYEQPLDDVYAISAHVLDAYPWTAGRRPDDSAGHSILIYDLRKK